MHVIGLQYDIIWEDKAANYQKIRRMLQQAGPQPGALVILPEMSATGFSMQVEQIAEPEMGMTEQFFANLAKEFQVYLVGGKVSTGTPPKGRNEAVVFNPQGSLLARYAKQRAFNPGGEGEHYECGRQNVLLAADSWRWSPFICYDLRFPELFRRAVKEGAELFVIIANWPTERIEHWLTFLRARAIENQAYVVGVNRCGLSPKLHYGGCSLIIGPRGETLAAAGEGEEIIKATLERDTLLSYRRDFPVLADMLE